MSIFKSYLARLFPPHDWVKDNTGTVRTCACCGLRQEIGDDAMCCPVWITVADGDPRKHYNQ